MTWVRVEPDTSSERHDAYPESGIYYYSHAEREMSALLHAESELPLVLHVECELLLYHAEIVFVLVSSRSSFACYWPKIT